MRRVGQQQGFILQKYFIPRVCPAPPTAAASLVADQKLWVAPPDLLQRNMRRWRMWQVKISVLISYLSLSLFLSLYACQRIMRVDVWTNQRLKRLRQKSECCSHAFEDLLAFPSMHIPGRKNMFDKTLVQSHTVPKTSLTLIPSKWRLSTLGVLSSPTNNLMNR